MTLKLKAGRKYKLMDKVAYINNGPLNGRYWSAYFDKQDCITLDSVSDAGEGIHKGLTIIGSGERYLFQEVPLECENKACRRKELEDAKEKVLNLVAQLAEANEEYKRILREV